jgi:hypothetical protein
MEVRRCWCGWCSRRCAADARRRKHPLVSTSRHGRAILIQQPADDDFERDKYRVENRFDEFGNDISNFPENAAGWTGEQVGRVENFDDRVENRFDNAVNDVEDFPENAARWGGEKVQEVEDIPQDIENKWDNAEDDVAAFGGRMDQAYDDGRDEQRYDDDNRDDW